MILYIMRHGETASPHRFCGRTDVGLSNHGLKQTNDNIVKLSKEPIKTVYSTGLQRTDIAAKKFQEATAVSHIIDQRFIELDFGDCECLTPEEINRKFPEVVSHYMETGILQYPNGETIAALVQRVSQGLKDIINTGQNSLIITHNGVIRAIHMYLKGGSFDQYDAKTGEIFQFKLDSTTNGAITKEH